MKNLFLLLSLILANRKKPCSSIAKEIREDKKNNEKKTA